MPFSATSQMELRKDLPGLEVLQRVIAGSATASAFDETLGIRLVHAEPGLVRLTCTMRPEFLNRIGSGHGGFVSTLLDNACGMAADSLSPAGLMWTTMDLHVRFLKPVRVEDGELTMVGHVDHAGRHTSITHGEVLRADGALLATATSSLYAIHPWEGRQP